MPSTDNENSAQAQPGRPDRAGLRADENRQDHLVLAGRGALFLATEPGLNALDVYQVPIQSWEDLLQRLRRDRRRQPPLQDGDHRHGRQRLQVLHRLHADEVQDRARVRSGLRQGLRAHQQRVPARAHQAGLPALRAVPHLPRQGDGGGLAHRQVHAHRADAAGQGPQDRARAWSTWCCSATSRSAPATTASRACGA